MSEIEIIQKEKTDFIGNHSKQLYQELTVKDENHETVIFIITKLLLNPNPLNECQEYQTLTKFIEEKENDKNELYFSNILSSIIQILHKTGSYDYAEIIQSYFGLLERVKESKTKRLIYR